MSVLASRALAGSARDHLHHSILPSLDHERALWESGLVRVAGVDEAGLGSLCGPVVAAAVIVAADREPILGVRDSKLLTRAEREAILPSIRELALGVGVGAASVAEIERLNVRRASHLAMRRALARIGPVDHAIVDGKPIRDPRLGPHTTIVDGDALSYSIACASIVAKVTRDRLLVRLSRRHPGYGWDHNAGYGTAEHLDAIRRLGVTPYHRLYYAPIRAILSVPSIAEDLSVPPLGQIP